MYSDNFCRTGVKIRKFVFRNWFRHGTSRVMNDGATTRKPTIRDIAREVGVSTTTVINVLKGRASEVSPATSKKIHQVVKRLGYVKNLTAASLSTRRSHVIAVVISGAFHPDEAKRSMEINPFYGDFVFRLEHAARARGYSLGLYAGNEEGALPFLLQRQYDAVLLLGVTCAHLPGQIVEHHLPLILIDSFVDRDVFMRVNGDEETGGYLAAQHLIKRGRRNLAFVGDAHPEWKNLIPTIRYNGALKACREAGLPLSLVQASTSFKAGAAATEQVLKAAYDGVVAAADIVAVGLVQGLRHQGVDVPGRIAVTGYDNLLVARTCLPNLTTVDQHLDDKIKAALDLVQTPATRKRIVIKPDLVIREST
jgi:LacI family transcriptional regulator